jgi:hypothetical protein
MRTKAMIGNHATSGEPCSTCGATYAACTKKVLDKRRPHPCCGACGYTDTHDVRVIPPLQWRISDDEQAVVVWPKDLPSIAKQEAFEVTITKDELVMLWERLDRRSKGYDDDRTGGL